MATAQIYYKNLQTLAEKYSHNEAIVLRQAEGAVNLTNYYGERGDMATAQDHYKFIQIIVKDYPKNEQIMLQQVRGAYCMTTHYSRQGDISMSQTHYRDIKTLTKKYSHYQQIVLTQAVGAGSQLYYTLEEEKVKHKMYFLTLLEDLESLLVVHVQAKSKSWQKILPLLLEVRNANQWLKS